MGLLQIMCANSFTCLDHKYSNTHLTKFYEIVGTLEAPEKISGVPKIVFILSNSQEKGVVFRSTQIDDNNLEHCWRKSS